ncbi:MAG: FmdB family zinc ribbon protein [Planctomycetaceae bacterium]
MPLYEYVCDRCGERVELLIRGDEKPACPHCNGSRLTKLMSVVAGHVAGSSAGAPEPGGCGRPQCGMGGCAGLG